MKGIFIITSICSFTALFPLLKGILKLKAVNKIYVSFIGYIIIGSLIEIIGRLLVVFHKYDISRILSNVYSLFEALVFLLLFKYWGIIRRRIVLYCLCIIFSFTWIFDNLILNSINNVNSLHIILYSLVTVVISVKLFQESYLTNEKHSFKDPLTIISATLILNYSYRSILESLYLFKLDFSNNFYLMAFMIFVILNVLSNCTYTYAIHCMSQRRRLSSYY
jgi:hypothetical protein